MNVNIGVSGTEVLMEPDFLEDAKEVDVETPYGRPVGPIYMGNVGDKKVAFINILFTKGKKTVWWPINFRANVWA